MSRGRFASPALMGSDEMLCNSTWFSTTGECDLSECGTTSLWFGGVPPPNRPTLRPQGKLKLYVVATARTKRLGSRVRRVYTGTPPAQRWNAACSRAIRHSTGASPPPNSHPALNRNRPTAIQPTYDRAIQDDTTPFRRGSP